MSITEAAVAQVTLMERELQKVVLHVVKDRTSAKCNWFHDVMQPIKKQ